MDFDMCCEQRRINSKKVKESKKCIEANTRLEFFLLLCEWINLQTIRSVFIAASKTGFFFYMNTYLVRKNIFF